MTQHSCNVPLRKRFSRWLALLLCLSLLAGLVPGGIAAGLMKANAASGDTAELDLNWSFETLDAEGNPVNWDLNIPEGEIFSINNTDTNDGSNAVYINAQAKANYIQSALVPVEKGDTIELTFHAKLLSNEGKNVYAGIWFAAEEQYNYVDGNAAKSTYINSTEWTEYKVSWTTYPGAKYLWIEFGNHSGSTGDYLFDNFKLTINGESVLTTPVPMPVPPEPEAPATLFADDFENGLAKWSKTHGHIMHWVPDDGHSPCDGQYVLLMQDYATDVGHTATTERIGIVPGEDYTLNYMVTDHGAYVGSSIGSEVKLYFTDAAGNELADAAVTAPAASTDAASISEWTKMTLTAKAPADAAALCVAFNTPVEKSNVIYIVDALTVTGLAPAVEETPDPTTPAPTDPTEKPNGYVAPTISKFPGSHPYVFFNSGELDAIRAVKDDAANSIYGFSWKSQVDNIIRSADTYLTETQIIQGFNFGTTVTFDIYPVLVDPNDLDYYRDDYEAASKDENGNLVENPYLGFGCLIPDSLRTRLETLSLAYALTGDMKYAERAIFYAESMSNWEWWGDYYWLTTYSPGSKCDASVAWTMQGVAAVYDLCYDAMTDAQRKTIETAIVEKGLYYLSQGYNVNSTANGNMMLLGGLLTGISVIISEDNYDTLKPYVDQALQGVHQAFTSYYESGNTEGHYYTSFGLDYFLPGVGHLYRAIGLAELGDHPLLKQMLPYWTVQWAAPGSSSHPNYGDGSINVYMKTSMAVISKMINDPLANYFLVKTGGVGDAFSNLMYLNPNPTTKEPTDYGAVVKAIGYGALRTGFATDDMLLTLIANNSQMGHNHFDQNSIQFNISGNWVMLDPGAGSYYYEDRSFWTHSGHNTILVDDTPQSFRGTGSMDLVFNNKLYSYIIGSAPEAYGSGVLDRFDRHAIQINHEDKAYYIVIDDLLSSAERVYSWQMFNGSTVGLEVDGAILPELTTVTGNDVSLVVGVDKLNLSFVDADGVDMTKKIYTANDAYVGETFIASSAAAKAHQFMTIISNESVMGRNYVNFGSLVTSQYTDVDLTLENGVSFKTSHTGGRVNLKPNQIGTISTIFLRGGAPGDFIKIPFEVAEDGTYDLTLIMGVSDGCCTTKVSIDDIATSEAHDLSGLPETTYNFEFKDLKLTAGTHYATYEVVDKGYSESYAGDGWYLINVGGMIMTRTDVKTEEAAVMNVTVAETYDNENALGALINYTSGKYDLVMFNRIAGMSAAGKLSTDGQQASVLGIVDGKITEGFAAAGATTAVYDGITLFKADAALDIVAGADGWTVISETEQTVWIKTSETVVSVNGVTAEGTVVENGMLAVKVAAGESVITPGATQTQLDGGIWIIIAIVAAVAVLAVGAFLFIKKRKTA